MRFRWGLPGNLNTSRESSFSKPYFFFPQLVPSTLRPLQNSAIWFPYEIVYIRGRFSFYVHSNVREKQKEKEKEHVPFPFPFPFRGAIFGCEKAVCATLGPLRWQAKSRNFAKCFWPKLGFITSWGPHEGPISMNLRSVKVLLVLALGKR